MSLLSTARLNFRSIRSSDVKFLNISPNLLLSVYLVIPLAVLLMVLDISAFSKPLIKSNSYVLNSDLAFLTLVLALPHIIASFFGLFDKEYISTYGKKVLRSAKLAIIVAIILPLISLKLAFFGFALLTMFHVFRQQSGIAKSLMQGTNKYHVLWEWTGISLSLLLYLAIYGKINISKAYVVSWLIIMTVFTFFGLLAMRVSKTKKGKSYMVLTHLLPIASGGFLLMGYPILSIIVPRLIHDFTGYIYYICHDNNRFCEKKTNLIYRYFATLGIPVLFLSPFLSIGITLVAYESKIANAYMFLAVLTLMHYFNESFLWKRGSLHRNYIKILA